MALRSSIFVIFSVFLAAQSLAQPKDEHVTLREFTRLSLDVVPDYGTQLVFPFVLDGTLEPALEINNTNQVGFAAEHTAGQNTILITAKTPQGGGPVSDYRGLLFITVGGYHITIELRTASRISKNIAAILFDIDPDEREYLLSEAVKRKTAQLESDYQARVAALDAQVEARALNLVAELAYARPKTQRVKSADEAILPTNIAIELYADEWKVYPSFAILVFELSNKSAQRLAINNASIVSVAEDDQERSAESTYQCDGALDADARVRCTLTTRERSFIDAERLKLVLTTDRGVAYLSW